MFSCLPTSLSLRKHSTEWKILRAYGLLPYIVTIRRKFYELFECSVILENTLPESFPIKSRVQQSFILSNLFCSSHRLGDKWNNLRPSAWNPVDLGLTFRRTWLCRWSCRHVSHSTISRKNSTDKAILQSKPVCSLSLQRPRWFTDVNTPTTLPITISGKELLSWIALTISLISKALLVMTMVPIKITRLALLKPEVLSVDSATSGSLRSGFKATLVRLFFWKCWRVKKGDMRKSYLSKICDNYWTNKITNKERHKNWDSIKSRTTDCNGLVLRIPGNRIPKVALRLTPTAKRNSDDWAGVGARAFEEIGGSKYEKLPKSCRATCGKPCKRPLN